MDSARRTTDQQISAMRREFTADYDQLGGSMSAHLAEYLADFVDEEGNVEATALAGRKWARMRDQLAREVTEVNAESMHTLDGRLGEVRHLTAGGSPAQSAVPHPAIDRRADLAWNRRKVEAVARQGIGRTPAEAGERMRQVSDMNYNATARRVRTAVNGAENAGRMDAMIARGGSKRWITMADELVRDSHAELHGMVVPVEEEFPNGLMFPGDPSGPPEEVYNCRCSIEWVDTGSEADNVPMEEEYTFLTFDDTRDAVSYFAEDSAELKASTEHAEALHGYTAYSNRIQEYARESTGPRSVLETMDRYEGIPEQVRLMDEWIASRELDEGLTVYRTLGQDTFERAVTDGVYRDSGFTSTTTNFDLVSYGNPDKPQSVWMEIQVPPGRGRGAYLEAVSEYSESEYLLPRGQEMRILGSRVDGEGRTIYQARVM